MKRDMDLVERILLAVEADRTPPRIWDGYWPGLQLDFPDVSPFDVSYHVLLLSKRGLVETAAAKPEHLHPPILRLTWDGHDFLDSLRAGDDDEIPDWVAD